MSSPETNIPIPGLPSEANDDKKRGRIVDEGDIFYAVDEVQFGGYGNKADQLGRDGRLRSYTSPEPEAPGDIVPLERRGGAHLEPNSPNRPTTLFERITNNRLERALERRRRIAAHAGHLANSYPGEYDEYPYHVDKGIPEEDWTDDDHREAKSNDDRNPSKVSRSSQKTAKKAGKGIHHGEKKTEKLDRKIKRLNDRLTR